MKYKYKTKPYKHQHKNFIRLLKQGHLGLLWEPGVGKSKPIVDWLSALYMKGDITRALIVAPLSVLSVWEDEFEAHSPLWDWGDINLVLFDKTMDRVPRYKRKLNLCVINYDLIWRREDIIVKGFKPPAVVADESHLMKKPSANRTTTMWKFNDAPYRSILTGTPTPRSLIDLYAQWKFLNKKRFGTNKEDYVENYVVMGGYMNKQVKGYNNVAELKAKVKKDSSKRRKDQCLDLPPEQYQKIEFDLEPKVRELYNKLAMEFFLELDGGHIVDAKNAAVKLLRLRQLTGGWIGVEEGNPVQVSRAKLTVARDLLHTRFEMGQKVVLFTEFIPEIERLVKVGHTLRVPTFQIRGGVKPEDRARSRRTFQAQKGAALFICQAEAGGLGITLHSSNEALFYSPSYRLDSYIQDRGRLHRSGQKRKVIYRHLVARNTVDLDVYRALRDKQNVMDLIMGKPKLLVKGIV